MTPHRTGAALARIVPARGSCRQSPSNRWSVNPWSPSPVHRPLRCAHERAYISTVVRNDAPHTTEDTNWLPGPCTRGPGSHSAHSGQVDIAGVLLNGSTRLSGVDSHGSIDGVGTPGSPAPPDTPNHCPRTRRDQTYVEPRGLTSASPGECCCDLGEGVNDVYEDGMMFHHLQASVVSTIGSPTSPVRVLYGQSTPNPTKGQL